MTKQAKLASQARLPEADIPLAMPTRSDSAIPTLKNRCGNFLAKCSVRVELWTSPSSTTISEYCSPSLASAKPNVSRTDLPIFMVFHLLLPVVRSRLATDHELRTTDAFRSLRSPAWLDPESMVCRDGCHRCRGRP